MKKKFLFMSMLAMGLLVGCNGTTPETSTPASGNKHQHTWDEGEVTKEATCTAAGEKTYHCTDPECPGEGTKTEKISALGHKPGETYYHDGESHWQSCEREGCEEKANIVAHSFTEGTKEGKVTKESCACGMEAFRFDVADAEGWNNPNSKMNGKTAPDNQSTWALEGKLPAGTYSVQLSVKLSYDSHGDRYWYNQWETDTATDADKEEQAPFRYFIKLDDGEAVNPTNRKTWSEDGLNASDYKYVEVIDTLTVTKDNATLSLVHGDIGYSVTINHVRLVAKN